MKKDLLKLATLFLFSTLTFSCGSDDNGSQEKKVEYPITLSFKQVGEKTLEHWKGGVLVDTSVDNYSKYIKDNCPYSNETEENCKTSKITFKDDTHLSFSYGKDTSLLELEYKFVNDTLKLIYQGESLDLGVGSRNELKIYGNEHFYRYKNATRCGGDEFFKYNFDGQYFLNSDENHNLPFKTPQDMGKDDIVTFYNVEYILRK